MTRYAGVFGLRPTMTETEPGIYSAVTAEIAVSGEVRLQSTRWSGGELLHNSATAGHVLSVIAPDDLRENFERIIYATWQGRAWNVTSIQYKPPRLEVTLGGPYNASGQP